MEVFVSPRDLGLGTGIPSFCIFIQFFASDLDFGGGHFFDQIERIFLQNPAPMFPKVSFP